jgi:D-alanyl-D-alanine carboxypeptidase
MLKTQLIYSAEETLMADKEKNFIKAGAPYRGERRTYRGEILAALLIIVIVIAIAFRVNQIFFGFDNPQITLAGTSNAGKDEGAVKPQAGFRQSSDWKLMLVNQDHPLEKDFDGELTELRYGQSVDSRIYPDLQAMFDEMRADGLSPKVAEGYRSREDQAQKLSDKIEDYISYGKSREEATELALTRVEEPGTCEHETGMCVDISSEEEDNESSSEVWKWMDENGSRYGFIKRYPYDKSDITGIKGEPWHYRYVGTEAAEEIMEKGITLEEYLGAAPRSGRSD